MALLLTIKTMPRRRWGSYTQLTVRCILVAFWWVILTSYISIIIGLGALVSPLVATQFAQLHRWSFHYLVTLAVALLNTILLICIFKFKTQDGEFTFPNSP